MRDRLIELFKQADEKAGEYIRENDHMDFIPTKDEIAGVYADHLLANNVIVPPCKVGTKVYIAYEEHINQVFDGSLVSYSLDAAHLWFNCHYTCGLNMWHPIEDLGKTVFLTREEAEKALKERE